MGNDRYATKVGELRGTSKLPFQPTDFLSSTFLRNTVGVTAIQTPQNQTFNFSHLKMSEKSHCAKETKSHSETLKIIMPVYTIDQMLLLTFKISTKQKPLSKDCKFAILHFWQVGHFTI